MDKIPKPWSSSILLAAVLIQRDPRRLRWAPAGKPRAAERKHIVAISSFPKALWSPREEIFSFLLLLSLALISSAWEWSWGSGQSLNQWNQCGRDAPVILPDQGLGLKEGTGNHRECGAGKLGWNPCSLCWIAGNAALDWLREVLALTQSFPQHFNYSPDCINDHIVI